METNTIDVFKGLADDALKAKSLLLRQKRAGEILSEARKHLTWEEFQKLENHVFRKLESARVIIHYDRTGKLGNRGPF